MDGAAVEQLVGLSRKPMELGGYLFRPTDWVVDDPAALVKAGPTAETMAVATLGAIRDYVRANKDKLDLDRMLVHIVSPNQVAVLGPLADRDRTREQYVTATCVDLTDGFLGKFMALADFLLGLQVRFVEANDRKRLLALLSNVKDETVKTALDDGVTQVVQARAGVTLVSEAAVPNPVLLTGYRTFRDIVQPDALYVLRVSAGPSGGLPTVGLFEADGGAWRLTTITRIHEWLTHELPTNIAILA